MYKRNLKFSVISQFAFDAFYPRSHSALWNSENLRYFRNRTIPPKSVINDFLFGFVQFGKYLFQKDVIFNINIAYKLKSFKLFIFRQRVCNTNALFTFDAVENLIFERNSKPSARILVFSELFAFHKQSFKKVLNQVFDIFFVFVSSRTARNVATISLFD